MAKRLRKEEFLRHWRALTPVARIEQSPIPYKHSGSTYGEDSVRLTGSPEFVDAVLSRIQDLLDGENGETRLGVNYGEIEPREDKNPPPAGTVACYIQRHWRGDDARIMARKIELMGQGRYAAAYVAQFEPA